MKAWGGALPVAAALLVTAGCSGGPEQAAPALPDFSGVWIAADTDIDISGYPTDDSPAGMALDLLRLDAAPLNEQMREWTRTELPKVMAGDALRRGQGWGYPLMMEGVAPLQFLVTPQETLILNFYRDIRHVYTDGRPLPAEEDRWPVPWGESVGHWEGDTLVIETVSVRNGSVLPLKVPPLSDAARFTERLRRTAPDRLELQMRIEDPLVLDAPWDITFEYRRAEGIDRLIHDVMENDRTVVDGDSLTIAPP
jgi:hypothetical protein